MGKRTSPEGEWRVVLRRSVLDQAMAKIQQGCFNNVLVSYNKIVQSKKERKKEREREAVVCQVSNVAYLDLDLKLASLRELRGA